MAKMKGNISVDVERCKGCGVCVEACGFGVIALSREVNGKGYPYLVKVNADACTGCTNCAVVCPDTCIAVYRQPGVEPAVAAVSKE